MSSKPPKTLSDWIAYLHAASAIPKESPDYGDAQEAVRFALQRIRTMNTVANAGDQAAAEQGKRIGKDPASAALGAATTGMLHGASFGAGEPIAGVIDALLGGSFSQGAGRYRQGLENIGTQQPTAAPAGEMLGMGAMSAIPVGQGVQAGTTIAREATQGVRGPNAIARFLLGAMHTNVAPGATLGAIQGFSAGGADPGDMQARIRGGVGGAAAGAGTQAFFGGLGALRVPRWLTAVRKDLRAQMPKGTDPALVQEVEDAALRAGLKREGYDAATQDRILSAWRAGKTKVPNPLPPPTQRPGETITPKPISGVPAPGPGVMPYGPRETVPADPRTVAPRLRGEGLLPQDKYAETQDLRNLLKMGPKYGIEGTYAKAIREELARRAQGIMPPNTVP